MNIGNSGYESCHLTVATWKLSICSELVKILVSMEREKHLLKINVYGKMNALQQAAISHTVSWQGPDD